MSNERVFWDKVAGAVNPGWTVELLGDGHQPALLGTLDVFVYVVDLAVNWVGAGALSEAIFLRAHADVSADRDLAELVRALAPGEISHHSAAKPHAGTDETRRVVNVAVMALTQTVLFDHVARSFGRRAGHWLYSIYSLKNGDKMGRGTFIPRSDKVLLDQDLVRHAARDLLRVDLSGQTRVGAEIRRGGGCLLADEFSTR